MAQGPPHPQPGDVIAGKYQVEAELGRGGMGAVYAARHVATGRRFAIKLLNPELAGDPEAEARFLREAMLASAINHPAIIEVYDVGRQGDSPYMVMKLLEGETLGARLKHGPLAADEAVAIMVPVLQGIAAAHARGILHRDLKPDNILLSREGGVTHPKVLDFGISKLLNADVRTKLTRTGVTIGTPLYMSPEQVRGEEGIDARADVYSLGVILYETLTGVLPYDGNNYADLILRIITGGAPGVRVHNPALPESLEAVVARAIATSREQRHASVTELAEDLARFRHVRASAATQPAIAPKPPRVSSTPFTAEADSKPPPARRSNAVLYTIAALGVLVAAALVAWLNSPEPSGAKTAAGAVAVPAPAVPAPLPVGAAPQPAAPAPEPAAATAPAEPAPGLARPSDPSDKPLPVVTDTRPQPQPAPSGEPAQAQPLPPAVRAGAAPVPGKRARAGTRSEREPDDEPEDPSPIGAAPHVTS